MYRRRNDLQPEPTVKITPTPPPLISGKVMMMRQTTPKRFFFFFALLYVSQEDLEPEPTVPNTTYLRKVRMMVRLNHPSKPKDDRLPPLGRWKVIHRSPSNSAARH